MKIDVSTTGNGYVGNTLLEKRHISTRATVSTRGNSQLNYQENDWKIIRLTAITILVVTFVYIAFSIVSKATAFKLLGA